MKKIIGILAMVVAVSAAAAVWYGQQFHAERIVERSSLKGRSFKGQVQEVSALEGTVNAYLMEEHSVPLAVVSFGFDKAGRAYEPKDGVALLAESVLLDGAGGYSRRELRELMAEKGIKLSVSAENDRLEFSLSFVKEFAKEALEVLKAVLYEPHLLPEDLEMARKQLAVLKNQQAETPQYHLGKLIKQEFYAGHPYGRENIPEAAVLAAISAADIRAYLKDYMGRDNLKVGVAGDMDRAETEAFLAQAFAGLAAASKTKELPAFSPVFDKEPAAVSVPSSAQSYVMLAAQGVKRLDEDFYPLYLADYIFGGSGLNSRLNQVIREKKGLTYGIYSSFSNSDAVDLWQVYFSATPDNAGKALDIAQKVYADFYKNGVTAAELEQAKKGLLNSFNLRFASLANIAEMLEQMQVQRLGADFLEKRQAQVAAVSLEAVNDAIKRKMPKTLDNTGGVRVFAADGAK